jgi:serine/threonine-protein kinase
MPHGNGHPGPDDESTGAFGGVVGPDAETSAPPPRSAGPAREAEIPPDRYRVEGELGSGGMATVVAADDLKLERTVAIKRMRPELAADAATRRRFVREARILAALGQHGTVAVYDLAGEDRAPFYAMERVRGKTLGELLRARTKDEIGSRERIVHFVDVFESVCRTIAYAHSTGVIHRDLKPSNVMVDDEFGAVRVMDWGIAKRIGRDADDETDGAAAGASDAGADATVAGAVMGTPGYMSPEQLRATATAGFESDVFALGVILYEILTGKKPFAARTPFEAAQEVLHHDPPAPRSQNPRAGRELSAICMKALAKDPRDRYPSARELADDVRRLREFRPVSVAPPRWHERVVNWIRRHRVVAAALGALLAAALVVLAFVAVRATIERRILRLGLATIEEAFGEAQRVEQDLAAARARQGALAAGSTARAAADAEVRDLQARLAAAQLTLRGRVAAVLGFTLGSPHPRVVEIGRWQSLHLVEMMAEQENWPMVRALGEASLAQVKIRNVLRLSEAEQGRLRELIERAEAELR